jgi:mRNA-degrading endonuclease toxin of MazEF toxin-antitoxin module
MNEVRIGPTNDRSVVGVTNGSAFHTSSRSAGRATACPIRTRTGTHPVTSADDHLHHPNLRLVIVVPGTTTLRRLPLHVVVEPHHHNGLDHPTAFQVEQVRAISTTRLVERLGRLDAEARHTVDAILRNVLHLH